MAFLVSFLVILTTCEGEIDYESGFLSSILPPLPAYIFKFRKMSLTIETARRRHGMQYPLMRNMKIHLPLRLLI